ncbi:hypothetical protein BU090_06580 [Staphylococcus warneri]|uniref:Uncharacterized protein n=1 Tax=Staphylococcus warneri TaxID=1292 RepID=A0A2T4PXY9_STAWA|nr:hypothetical protein Ssp1_04440 [Staphylococcus sp. M0911]OLS05856.1 hypothetical protein AUK68_07960 [Staphylococcus epidermidis]PTI14362.1 hypothetical protein BU083_04440 [Staphylococcus warneri]PTI18633.1 hypothetical protein BU084_02845 [Staphylococcus warneri]PTI20158.1 hypothetical protein BU082_06415 [Staphylococcus warneri]
MKVIGYILSFILLILFIYNIFRFIMVLIENTLNVDFGMETLLHNSYFVNGGVFGAIIIIIALELINHLINEEKF